MTKIISAAALTLVCLCCLPGMTHAQGVPGGAAREFTRLKTLQAALAKIPMEKQEKEPHKSFLRKNENDITYSEPSGQWYLRSDRFWELLDKNSSLPIAEDIAWTAAQNPIPGECEGYINCYVYIVTVTDGRYLSYYPNGKHSKQALSAIVERLEPLAADDSQYDGPTEVSDRAELQKTLAELRNQISGSNNDDKAKALAFIAKLETKHK
jgi:hypothetical protein